MLLLGLFALPLVSPLLAVSGVGDASLPACCRRQGKHHCLMTADQRKSMGDREARFKAPPERCPYTLLAATLWQNDSDAPAQVRAVVVGLTGHPAAPLQTESGARIARARSHGKRGPPLA